MSRTLCIPYIPFSGGRGVGPPIYCLFVCLFVCLINLYFIWFCFVYLDGWSIRVEPGFPDVFFTVHILQTPTGGLLGIFFVCELHSFVLEYLKTRTAQRGLSKVVLWSRTWVQLPLLNISITYMYTRVASYADALLPRHAISLQEGLRDEDCVTSQRNVCVGG